MAINKVVYGNNTLVDLTNDTVEASNLLEGETAHDRSGSPVTGTAKQGHVILDQNGNALDQEPNMQFVDAHTSDDSVNTKTIIENIKSVIEADFRTATEDGLYDVDVEGAEIGEISEDYVEVVADGDKTYAQLFAELWTKIDTSKVTGGAFLSLDKSNPYSAFYKLRSATSSAVSFVKENANTSNPYVTIEMVYISANFNALRISNPSSYSDAAGNVKPSQGTVITLYYGNDKAVVDLQTTANRCLMSNGESVQDYISPIGNNHQIEYIPFGKGWNGRAYTFIPLLNADKYTIRITNAMVYNGGSSAVDITSSVSIGNKTRDGFNIVMSSNTYVGECVRLSFTVS